MLFFIIILCLQYACLNQTCSISSITFSNLTSNYHRQIQSTIALPLFLSSSPSPITYYLPSYDLIYSISSNSRQQKTKVSYNIFISLCTLHIPVWIGRGSIAKVNLIWYNHPIEPISPKQLRHSSDTQNSAQQFPFPYSDTVSLFSVYIFNQNNV